MAELTREQREKLDSIDWSLVDWDAVAEDAGQRTIDRITGGELVGSLRDRDIAEGRGRGDYGGAPLSGAFQDDDDSGIGSRFGDILLSIAGRLANDIDIAGRISGEYYGGEYYGGDSSPVDSGLTEEEQALEDELAGIGDDPGGGPGGGGYRAPAKQYIGPDRGLVEDWVKSRLVTLVGKADDDRISMLADKYYDADRKNFGITKGEGVDAKQTVLESIREFDDYQRIHANRTDMQDEDTWISGQMSALLNAGVSGQEAEKLAINFAQAGVAKVRAGELSEARRVGTAPTDALPGFFNKVQSAMSTVARSIR